jgi:hypothetical protein
MAQYRKNSIVIDAIQWTGNNFDKCMNFMETNHGNKIVYEDYEEKVSRTGILIIDTLEGSMTCSKNDYIIKGIKGEFYPCKPNIFEQTYTKI